MLSKIFRWVSFACFGSLILTIVISISSSCSQPTPLPINLRKEIVLKPGQDIAVELVWKVFNGGERIPPIVEWYEGDRLDCMRNRAFWAWTPTGPLCVTGEYISVMHLAVVAWPINGTISHTSFAHELCHAVFSDPFHLVCNHVGERGIVTEVNLQLEGMGL